jgi:hypothetical protein
LFSRKTSESSATPAAASPTASAEKAGGKGRPTPTRKEAEAAARARAKVPRTRKEMAAADKAQRKRALDGLKSGDEKYLQARDRGPVKRFIRDFVDSRFSFIEIMVPLLLASMILGYTGNRAMMNLGNIIMLTTLMMIVVDAVTLRFRLTKELARRFPGEPTKGTTRYAIMRSLQMKFMRLPKAQVKLGEKLPETYR